MRRYFIILAFLPLFSFGQYQNLALDFLFNGSIAVNGSDTLLVDSITGTFDADYVLTDVDFDINLGYIPGKTAAKLNGQPIVTMFQNHNYADTAFTQWLDQELNSDLTESLQRRIKRHAHYSTPTTDVNDFFETPEKGIGLDVGVGKTYTTIDAAFAAASANDTIYVYDGLYTVAITLTYLYFDKPLFIKAVGNSTIQGTSGARTILFVGAGTKIIEGFTVSGANTTRSVYETFSSSIDNYVVNCYTDDAPVVSYDAINIAVDSEMNINNCSFIGNNNAYLVRCDGLTQRFDNCFFGGHFSNNLYSISSDTTISFHYCDFRLKSGDVIGNIAFRAGRFELLYNNIELLDVNSSFIDRVLDGSGVNIYIKFNTINSDIAGERPIRIGATVFDSIQILNNSFNILNTSQANPVIDLSNIDCNIDVNNNYFNTLATGALTHIQLTATAATIGAVNINNNEHHSRSNTGYVIRIGSETTTSGDYLIDGGNIKENIVYGALYYDDAIESVSTHGVFIGFNKNWTLKYNYVDGCGINYIQKSSSGVNTTGGFFYNKSFNPYLQSFYSKGHESVKFYNNSSSNTLDNEIYHFYVSENIGGDGANNCDFKNNAVSDSRNNAANVGIRINTGVTGTLSDYNNFYTAGGNFGQDATTTRTLSAWQSANSLDLNSLDENPNWDLNLVPPSNSSLVENAVNLGVYYKEGLDILSSWPDNIILKNQIQDWTIGAYVVFPTRASTIGGTIWIYQGKAVILK